MLCCVCVVCVGVGGRHLEIVCVRGDGAAHQTTNLRLTQSNVLPKWGPAASDGGGAEGDGTLHQDYGANMHLSPPQGQPEAVVCILYFGPGSGTGPTTFVPAEAHGAGGAGGFARSYDLSNPVVPFLPPEELYTKERAVG